MRGPLGGLRDSQGTPCRGHEPKVLEAALRAGLITVAERQQMSTLADHCPTPQG
jgi:hypothetical protein